MQLVLDVGAQPAHRALHHAGQGVGAQVLQHRRRRVQADDEQQDVVEAAEVDMADAAAPQSLDDHVGRVPQQFGAEDREHDTAEGQEEDGDDANPLGSHPSRETSQGLASVFRVLQRHPERTHAAHGPRGGRYMGPGGGLRFRRRLLGGGIFGLYAHAASSAAVCDATISA